MQKVPTLDVERCGKGLIWFTRIGFSESATLDSEELQQSVMEKNNVMRGFIFGQRLLLHGHIMVQCDS